MNNLNRVGNKWTVNEVLSLQREYELLGWDIERIAQKHGRTSNAIMYKLDQEGFADYDDLSSKYHFRQSLKPVTMKPSLDEDYVDEDEEEEYVNEDVNYLNLIHRVSDLESGLYEIKSMLRTVSSQISRLTPTQYGSHGLHRRLEY